MLSVLCPMLGDTRIPERDALALVGPQREGETEVGTGPLLHGQNEQMGLGKAGLCLVNQRRCIEEGHCS